MKNMSIKDIAITSAWTRFLYGWGVILRYSFPLGTLTVSKPFGNRALHSLVGTVGAMTTLSPLFQSTGVATGCFSHNWRESITLKISLLNQWNCWSLNCLKFLNYDHIYSKFRPVEAGYKIESFIFLSGPITNTLVEMKNIQIRNHCYYQTENKYFI